MAGLRCGEKKDVSQVYAVARMFGMDAETRWEFGDYIEDCKQSGERGSQQRGDFTWAELEERAREFLERR